jgi:hypothetical protein
MDFQNKTELTRAIRLVYHGLYNTSPCIDEPLCQRWKEREKRKKVSLEKMV